MSLDLALDRGMNFTGGECWVKGKNVQERFCRTKQTDKLNKRIGKEPAMIGDIG